MGMGLKCKTPSTDKDSMNSVMIVDDNERILCLMERALESDLKVYKSKSSFEGFEMICSFFPDLVVLNIKMPDVDGYELCSKLKTGQATKDIPIIFMADKISGHSRSLAYRLGAIHCLQRPFDLQEFRLLVKAVIAQIKGPLMDGNILEFEDLFLDVKNYYCSDDQGEYRLTRSECLLLETLMRAKNETVGREVLANKLNGYNRYNDHISFRTVDSHICSIRKKIRSSGLSISSVYNVGYRLQKIPSASKILKAKQAI